MVRNEVVLTDENLFQVLVYDRTENTPPGAEASKPKRVIAGEDTNIEFQSGVYVDQQTGEIFAANNDTRDTLVVFKHGSAGNVKPIRQVETPHGTFGVVVDEVHGELFMTEQHDSALVVYRKDATQEESPIRFMQGSKTGLQDPHGIALDPKDDVLFVANYGYTHDVALTDKPKTGVNQADNREGKDNWPLGREFAVPGSGTINPPSITVYRADGRGDAAPLRKIQGPDTGLNWPTGLAFDPQARELFVANDAAHEVLVFDAAANGNAKPKRSAEGREHEARQPHRRRRGHQEPRAVGRELRRAFRNGLRHLGVRERRAEADHPQRPGEHAVADDRQPRGGRVRREARGNPRPQLSRPSADCGVRQDGGRTGRTAEGHRGTEDAARPDDARDRVRRDPRRDLRHAAVRPGDPGVPRRSHGRRAAGARASMDRRRS